MPTPAHKVQVMPRWLLAVCSAMPGLAFLLTDLIWGLHQLRPIFGMNRRDSALILGINSILVGLVLGLVIICLAQARALKIAGIKP